MTITIPNIVMEANCPIHKSIKVAAGVTENTYVEFYCRHCKKTYVFVAKVEPGIDGREKIETKLLDKKDCKILVAV